MSSTTVGTARYDAIVIGAGHNGLIAAAYLARAGKKVLVLERREIVGGAAVTEEIFPGYKFTEFSYVVSLLRPEIIRDLELPRHGLKILPLPSTVTPLANGDYLAGWDDRPRLVVLDGAQRINAGGVIDARGVADHHHLDCGWQKFTGQLLQLAEPHSLTRPIVMDATVDQHDGYRFVYVLPFGMDKVFVEDTYYSDRPDLDRRVMAQRIAAYADNRGWEVERVLREETGVLPVVMGGDLENYWASGSGRTAKAGARGAFFHADHKLFIARCGPACNAVYVSELHRFRW